MKSKLILLFVLISVNSWLQSTIWHIKQDGTGDFTTIQAGIDVSANSDTVLVYPGTYYENLVILEKYITLGSLYLTTGNESHISQTILDGNYTSSVIRIEDSPFLYNVTISGFVIQNGSGYQYNAPYQPNSVGGGLYVSESNIILNKIIIQNNKCTIAGGGIALLNSNLFISGSTIRFNQCINSAGGLLIGDDSSNAIFDTNDLNNIYLNYAGRGNDIYITPDSPFQEIIVDTFTVIDPAEGYYFIYPGSGGAGIPLPGKFSTDIQHGYVEQVNHDLYVSPNGNNNNSGSSENDPLQSISFALIKISSDSLFQKVIHLSNGIYSVSQNNQVFRLHLKSYVDIIGESRENTILDAELNGGFIVGQDPQNDYTISNVKFYRSRDADGINLNYNSYGNFSNFIYEGHSDSLENVSKKGFNVDKCDIQIESALVENNNFGGFFTLYCANISSLLSFSNIIIRNNYPSLFHNLQIRCLKSGLHPDSLIVNIINSEITNNLDASYEWLPAASGIYIQSDTKLNLINSTVGNNICQNIGAAIQLIYHSTANIINSIIYGNIPYNICLNNTCSYDPNTLNANNSLIEGGIDGILNIGTNFINWDETTMLDEDPFWLGAGYEYPYALSANSPCIDTGTLELSYGVELPAYDLAGNPRVMGSNIDMGAYEFPGNAAPIYLEINNETLSWQMPVGFSPTAFKVYLDDEFQSTLTPFLNEYTFTGLIIGDTYKAGVSALYDTEETAKIPLQFIYQPVGIEEEQNSPLITQLSNFPNPFNPSTTIAFNLPESGQVTLEIYNIKGQKVKTLIDAQLSSGSYSVTWNGKNDAGKLVSSGEYISKLKVNGEEAAVQKMLLLK
ncbi:MAG: FlgD immunoglobulin-like domain containing protein [Candidatus Cloacimonadales bacterium]|nr:FlgD immunoglobulin-like domain containing protein [Candidatus Cloacimonadales bacterium]